MSRAARWLLFAATVAVCVATGAGAYLLAQHSWNAVVDYESPYASAALPATEPMSAEASRTVLVIIDGLRLDASRTMGTMQALRGSGRDLSLEAPQPSLSYPNWTTVLSGAPPYVSGVVTNWHEGEAPVETIFDTAGDAAVPTAFVGPSDFDTLYGVAEKTDDAFMLEWDERYLSDRYVDEALRIAETTSPRLLVVHLPDVDEAGHAHGGGSAEYAATVRRVDADLGRLVNGLQDGVTVFVVTADHGHIDTGGHGGWEDDVVSVPCVVTGPGVVLGEGVGRLQDVAPTVAALMGARTPRHALGTSVLATSPDGAAQRREADMRLANHSAAVSGVLAIDTVVGDSRADSIQATLETRLTADRRGRLPLLVLGVLAAALVVGALWASSRSAGIAALAGTAAYLVVYNGLFFVVHGYRWSLSAFNSEDLIEAWMNGRLLEAGGALLVAAAVAAFVYPYARRSPSGPRGEYLAEWLTLGPVTGLVVLAVLGLQVAWFAWWWGVTPAWTLPDLRWGFKYDLDLIQATAVGFASIATPLVTYVVGRYHPRVRTRRNEG